MTAIAMYSLHLSKAFSYAHHFLKLLIMTEVSFTISTVHYIYCNLGRNAQLEKGLSVSQYRADLF